MLKPIKCASRLSESNWPEVDLQRICVIFDFFKCIQINLSYLYVTYQIVMIKMPSASASFSTKLRNGSVSFQATSYTVSGYGSCLVIFTRNTVASVPVEVVLKRVIARLPPIDKYWD